MEFKGKELNIFGEIFTIKLMDDWIHFSARSPKFITGWTRGEFRKEQSDQGITPILRERLFSASLQREQRWKTKLVLWLWGWALALSFLYQLIMRASATSATTNITSVLFALASRSLQQLLRTAYPLNPLSLHSIALRAGVARAYCPKKAWPKLSLLSVSTAAKNKVLRLLSLDGCYFRKNDRGSVLFAWISLPLSLFIMLMTDIMKFNL